VTFENRGAHLVGTLYLPDRPDKVPGIIWVDGSGPQPRALQKPFAAHFARSGYAVLAYDKRGVGSSTGQFVGGERAICPDNIDLLASDASAALSLLSKRSEVRSDAVGFVGASQAGWITPRAAVMNGHAAFMLLLSGPTTSAHSILRLERLRLGPEDAAGPTLAKAIDAFRPGGAGVPDGLTPDQAYALAQNAPGDFPCPDYDPIFDLRALNIPGLWLLGDRDWIVPSGPTGQILGSLSELGKHYEYRNIPAAGHAMVLGPRELILETIDSWLARAIARQ
jgi:pimeloyl-ACP methyl ester carboxylesterase